MAHPIPLELPRRDPREALYERLETAPQEHAEALLDIYDILQGLHERGLLEMAKGALGSSDKLLEILVKVANTPDMIRGIRNMMILVKITNSFEPELLEGLEQGVQKSLAEARKSNAPGLWELAKKLLSQESRRVLFATAGILEAVGKSLAK